MKKQKEMIGMKEVEEGWTDLVSESLAQNGGELKLSYAPGNVEIELVSDDGTSIPIEVGRDGNLVFSVGNNGEVQVTMKEFFERVIGKLNSEYGCQLDVENYQRKNLLKNLLLLKHNLQ